MELPSKVEYLIVDTSAFIKNAPLKNVANKIVTEPSVIDEIKSKRQLKRLVAFPCQVDEIEVKEAFPEDIAFVTEFAKKTGDYISLSVTDIKVIALTLRYEREKVGTHRLKTQPETKKKIVDSSVHQSDDQAKKLVGFYMPKEREDDEESTDSGEIVENEESDEKNDNNDKSKEHRKVSECSNDSTEEKNDNNDKSKEHRKVSECSNDSTEEKNDNNDKSKEHRKVSECSNDSTEEKNDNNDKSKEHRKVSECSNSSTENSQQLVTANDESNESKSESDYDTAASDDEKKIDDDLNKMFEKLNCDPTELKIDCEGDLTVDDILKPVKNNSDKVDKGIRKKEFQFNIGEDDENDHDDYDDDNDDDIDVWDDDDGDVYVDDDDYGWITPSNIKDVKIKMDSGIVRAKPATVACLTMDYAMQNVMMQMGLNVSSLEGKVIKQMRTYILRCYTCFKTTGVVTKLFCPHCGHKTLKKVSVSIDDEGNQIIHINYKKPLTSKGKKFSLPTFKGGKHACNPILFEDQPLPDQRPTKLGRARNDPLNEDYLAGYSPFVMRDVNSRAAMLGIKSSFSMKYWMRRNPNQAPP